MKCSKKYLIEIKETLSRTISFEADTPDEALEKVEEAYDEGDIVLGSEDFAGVSFGVREDAG